MQSDRSAAGDVPGNARDLYRRFGMRTVINCATNYTRLGGSVVSPRVREAMDLAGEAFIDMVELHERAAAELATMTRNEAACITNGATAGLFLAVSAAMVGQDPALASRLPGRVDGLRNEVVMHRGQRNWYDLAIRQAGATLVEYGTSLETEGWELDEAITDRTAAVVWFAGDMFSPGALELGEVVARSHARGVPVIVEAASQVPPVSNLWRYTRDGGADVAIFSGGKNLRGPQNSGLNVGAGPLMAAMRFLSSPHQRAGRIAKVSREGIIGLVVAVEEALAVDEATQLQGWLSVLDRWEGAWRSVAGAGIEFERRSTNFAGEPVPRLLVRFAPESGWTRDTFHSRLKGGDPIIEVHRHDGETLAFSPHLLQEGEDGVVERVVTELLGVRPAG